MTESPRITRVRPADEPVVSESGRMTIQECADIARTKFALIPERIDMPEFPVVTYEVVDHGEFAYEELDWSTYRANPFAPPRREHIESLNVRVDVWSVAHPGRAEGELYPGARAEPAKVRWHGGTDSSASNDDSRNEAVRSALATVGLHAVFWVEKIRWALNGDLTTDERPPRRTARINGEHFVLGTRTSGAFRGFAGREIPIRFRDGETVVCRDLWHQGVIPVELRDLLPDNAEFVRGGV